MVVLWAFVGVCASVVEFVTTMAATEWCLWVSVGVVGECAPV